MGERHLLRYVLRIFAGSKIEGPLQRRSRQAGRNTGFETISLRAHSQMSRQGSLAREGGRNMSS